MANAEVFKIMGSVLLEDEKFISGLRNVMTQAESATSKLSKKFESVGRAFQTVGSKMQSVGRSVTAGTAVAVGSIGMLTKSAITAYANYEQLVGGVDTLFKESNKKVLEYAQNAYKTAGLSANAYMETVTSFSASLLQSLDGDTVKAAEYANRAVTDMSDNANKMGTDMSMIQNAYQGFAKQNYTMLDNLKLGYGGTKTEMERLIKDASKMTDTQKKLNVTVDEGDLSFSNIVNAISVVQSEMGIMGTTSKEAEGTITGSLNAMKGAWTNMLVAMADDEQDFEKVFNELLDSIGVFAKNLLPRIEIVVTTALKKILEGIKSLIGDIPIFGDIIDKLIELTTNFRTLDAEQKKQVLSWGALVLAAGPLITILGKLTSGVGSLITGVGKLVSLFGGGEVGLAGAITKAMGACGGLAPFLGIIAAAIVGIVSVVKVCKENWDKLTAGFKTFCEDSGLSETLDNIKTKFGELWEKLGGLGDLLTVIGTILMSVLYPAFYAIMIVVNVVASAFEALMDILGGVIDILSAIGSFIVGVFTLDLEKCGEAVFKLIEGIVGCFKGLFGLVVKPLKAFVEGVIGFFTGLWDTLVGHSIVPDTIDGIVACFKELLGKPIKFVKDFVGKVVDFFGNIKDKAVSAVKGMKDKISEGFSGMVTSAKQKLSSLATTVSSKFSSIPKTIGEKMSQAKTKVTDMLNKMKTAFSNFRAKIKLPHFKITNASLNPKDWITKGLPKLSVQWYEKGGIFSKPTIFDTASGFKGVGEAGPEAVAPISVLQGYVQDAVLSQNAEIENKLNTLIDILLKFLPRLENQSLVLDTGVLVAELTPRFDKSLGELTQKKIRGR